MSLDPTASPDALSVQPFTWDQLGALHALVALRAEATTGMTVETLRAQLAFPGVLPERDVLLALAGPRLLGYGWLRPEPAIARGVGELGVSEGGTSDPVRVALLAALRDRASNLALSELHVRVDERERALVELLMSAAYRPVRRFAAMRRSDLEAPPIESDALPAIRIRPFDASADLEQLTEVQNEAFAGSFGFAPNTPDQIAAYIELRGGPAGIQLAEERGAVVGYIWTSASTKGPRRTGRIEMMGVLPSHRGRGLGARLVARSFAQLYAADVRDVDLDVDAENAPALKLYADHGFVRTAASTWYALSLAAPAS